jgi:acetoin utilization deacetylase AcuC-like enzyme
MGKYALLRQAVKESWPGIEQLEALPASAGELALVHDTDYIQAVVQGQLDAQHQREIGFPWSTGMVERAMCSVGATLMAARTALMEGVSGNMAGGTHHAYRNRGGGFCVFNDVAVACRVMAVEAMRQGHVGFRVAVIDLDVHQGNGTAAIFLNDPSVFTLSLHGANNFPFRKERSDLDIDLADGCTDEPYLEALERALTQLEHQGSFDLIFYLAGVDPHRDDRLGRLALTDEGLSRRDARVFEWARARQCPVAFAMAGGYGPNLEHTVGLQLNTFGQAYQAWQQWPRTALPEASPSSLHPLMSSRSI